MNAPGRQYAEDVQAVLLVGGLGTRLRSIVPFTPKPLASIGDTPFLELLVRQLRCQGIRHMVMCTGYLSEQIEKEFDDGRSRDVTIKYSNESYPLGTAGALKLARPYLDGASDFLVMNGDSFVEIDFQQLIRFHREHGGLVSMAVAQVKNAARFGTVQMNAGGRVIGFSEKTGRETSGIVNAGVYIFNRALFDHIPEGPASLEREVFPHILRHGVYAIEQRGLFIDIGTPEDYVRVQQLSDRLNKTIFQKSVTGKIESYRLTE